MVPDHDKAQRPVRRDARMMSTGDGCDAGPEERKRDVSCDFEL